MRDLHGRNAIVTGAASGIGRALALELARSGVNLFLLDIEEHALRKTAAEAGRIGVKVVARHCDLADEQQIADAAAAAIEAFGRIQILVNNAGVMHYGDTHAMTGAQWDRVMAINLTAPMRMIQMLLPVLRSQPEAHILNISSAAGLLPKRRLAAYQASKFALVGLSQSLRAEYSPLGLGVTVVCPGLVETDLFARARRDGQMTSELRIPRRLCTNAEYIARKAVHAIRCNRAIVVVPLIAKLLWYLHRISPGILDWHRHFTHRRKARRRRQPAAEKSVASMHGLDARTARAGE